jgi:hypothetical protein
MASHRLFTVLAAAAALAGCTTAPASPELFPGPSPAAASTSPATLALTAAPAPSPVDTPSDPNVACERFDKTPFPAADLPTPDEQKALAGCDAEALYYGIGRPPDFVAARKCAYAERDDEHAPPIGGPAVLLMVYANGKGVPANFDLALRFACESGFAPAERYGRVSRVLAAREEGRLDKELDFCDDITSGFMMGWCASHGERIQEIARDARKQAATRGLPAPALKRLDKAAEAFFSARSMNEVDMSGTARGAISIGERASLRDDHVAMLEKLADPAFAPPAGDAAQAERALQQTYDDLMRCMKSKAPPPMAGVPEAPGIKKTELSWVAYREAWLSLVGGAKRQAWKAWLAEKRTTMLKELWGWAC